MIFEWDETKCESNLVKHGFDFLRVAEVFDDPHVIVPSKYAGNEPRFLAIGKIEGRFVAAVLTIRGDRYRIISLRSARDGEKQKYHELYGG